MKQKIEQLMVAFLYWKAANPDQWTQLGLIAKPVSLALLAVVSMYLLFTFVPHALCQMAVMAIVVSGLVWCLGWDD
jgi:hypothetical protein